MDGKNGIDWISPELCKLLDERMVYRACQPGLAGDIPAPSELPQWGQLWNPRANLLLECQARLDGGCDIVVYRDLDPDLLARHAHDTGKPWVELVPYYTDQEAELLPDGLGAALAQGQSDLPATGWLEAAPSWSTPEGTGTLAQALYASQMATGQAMAGLLIAASEKAPTERREGAADNAHREWLENCLAMWGNPRRSAADFVEWAISSPDAPTPPGGLKILKSQGSYVPFTLDAQSVPAFLGLEDELTDDQISRSVETATGHSLDDLLAAWSDAVDDLTDGDTIRLATDEGSARSRGLDEALDKLGSTRSTLRYACRAVALRDAELAQATLAVLPHIASGTLGHSAKAVQNRDTRAAWVAVCPDFGRWLVSCESVEDEESPTGESFNLDAWSPLPDGTIEPMGIGGQFWGYTSAHEAFNDPSVTLCPDEAAPSRTEFFEMPFDAFDAARNDGLEALQEIAGPAQSEWPTCQWANETAAMVDEALALSNRPLPTAFRPSARLEPDQAAPEEVRMSREGYPRENPESDTQERIYYDAGYYCDLYDEDEADELSEAMREDLQMLTGEIDRYLGQAFPDADLWVRGSVGRWDGTSRGFSGPYASFTDLISDTGMSGIFRDCDIDRIWETPDGSLCVSGTHHDGHVEVEARMASHAVSERFTGAAEEYDRRKMIQAWNAMEEPGVWANCFDETPFWQAPPGIETAVDTPTPARSL